MSGNFKKFGLALLASTLIAGAAQAGGFSRTTADTDILFEEGNFNMRFGVTYTNPTQKFSYNPNPALTGTDPYNSYVSYTGGIKFQIADQLSCAGTLNDVYGGSVSYAASTIGGKLNENFTITELGLTCGAHFDVGPGFASVIGGGFVEMMKYELDTALGTTTDLSGTDVGYRLGVAYSIPEIALRAQLMYRSGTQHNPTGTTSLTANGFVLAPASGAGNLPQSVELKVQSGIAPGWLAFGSVKWTDWSVLDTLDLNAGVFASQNLYYYRDGWTVSGGIGHQLSDNVSVFGAIQWDRGVGTGYDLASTRWTAGAGAAIKGNNGELSLTAAYTYLTGAAENKYPIGGGGSTLAAPLATGVNSSTDDGHAISLGASYKLKF